MLKHLKFHREIWENGRWQEMSIFDQLANIWAEVGRSLNNLKNGNQERFDESIKRAYELLDMAMADPKRRKTPKLREICLIRELISDYFFADNQYQSTPEFFERYFFEKTVIANEQRRKKRKS